MILTQSQGQRLATALHAARPDWPTSSITSILQTANANGGLPAHDFDHALRATIAYATTTGPNGYQKQTPAYLPEPSRFWDDTAPASSKHPRAKQMPCEDHPEENAHNCSCCWADIKIGQRPQHLLGKLMPPSPPNTQHPAAATETALESIQAE